MHRGGWKSYPGTEDTRENDGCKLAKFCTDTLVVARRGTEQHGVCGLPTIIVHISGRYLLTSVFYIILSYVYSSVFAPL